MRTLSFWAIGAVFVGFFAACVGDDPAATSAGAQGAVNGPCYANGTCNPGLSCDVASGDCVVPSDASASGDASTTSDAGTTMDDSGSNDCTFSTSIYPCKDPNPTTACYGTVVSCTASGCGGSDMMWTCFSGRQCNTAINCCLPLASADLNVGTTCAEGTLDIVDGGTLGASCASTKGPCDSTQIQLCQAKADCPVGQKCNQVKVHGGGAALDNQVDIGACVPE